MKTYRNWRDAVLSDNGILILLALALLIFHMLTNRQYGFHRDELDTLANSRFLDWGYGENFWKLGTNSYQIIADCPDTEFFGDIDRRFEFSVGDNAQLFPNNVIEFRINGMASPNPGGPKLLSINPKQKTKSLWDMQT